MRKGYIQFEQSYHQTEKNRSEKDTVFKTNI